VDISSVAEQTPARYALVVAPTAHVPTTLRAFSDATT
jgi:hypothetical protein